MAAKGSDFVRLVSSSECFIKRLKLKQIKRVNKHVNTTDNNTKVIFNIEILNGKQIQVKS
jgi:hypothetical protein